MSFRCVAMSHARKTAVVTGASQGIGAGIVRGFVERGFNVVANSRKMTESQEVAASAHVALVDGHIGEPATAAKIVETALSRFQSIDVLVNNAGIFFTKAFTDYTVEDVKANGLELEARVLAKAVGLFLDEELVVVDEKVIFKPGISRFLERRIE